MNKIVKITNDYVFNLFENDLLDTFVYHNYVHTHRVVKSTNEIITHANLSEKEELTLQLAAWLHDTGYTVDPHNHEEESAKIARNFLEKNEVDKEIINNVESCILATKMDVIPSNDLEKIIKDADCSHFAKDYFMETSDLLRKELKLQNIKAYSSDEWLLESINFFIKKHSYYTPYALQHWEGKKQENLLKLIEKLNKKKKKKDSQDDALKAKIKAQIKNDSPERGVQTLFRVTLRNHIKLSDIADTKANILLSVNAIIISLALSSLIPKLDSPGNHHLIIPTMVLVLSSVVSIILSIMSTRPNVTSGEFTKEQIKNRQVNILFFGNFHKMPYDEYQWAIKEISKDKEHVYELLTKDLYYLGIVLNRKYKLLRVTYNVFMAGIIISVIAFLIAFYSI
ncbi:Pycsar system effector family protein [Aquimarina hainanensis]|uniref:Pycsar system effector family protein n=1 Tax=Aquimarina hainanensis TaxID=1578017 RepID=A0ABW5NEX7_9FLAO|nr:Pycsar system effector family protein [Aquimarina sp. TRL1]QKX07233.1 HD domain-containing protein [Aquimarina sp. TRL1]